MNQFNKFQLFVLFSLFSNCLFADTLWYQVEAIVFEQNMPNTEEFYQTYPELEMPVNPAYLSSSKSSLPSLLANRVAYARVNPEDMLLNGTYNKIERSNNYRPLLHASWIQPASSNQINKGVYLGVTDSSGNELLNGILKVQRGHYLHLIMDMEYAPGEISSGQNGQFSEPSIYRIKEKRRTRLNEIHYLDHPKFGVILTIKPLGV